MPGGAEVRVRSVQVHDQPVERAEAGRRVAASLVGVERSAIPRGASLATPGALPESYRLDVELRALAGGPGVAHGALVQVLIGTACVDARVALLESERLAAGSAGLAQLRLRELVVGRARRPRDPAHHRSAGHGRRRPRARSRTAAPRRQREALERLRLLAGGDAPSLVRPRCRRRAWPLALAQIAPPGVLEAPAALAALAELCESGEVLAARRARRRRGSRPRATPSCAAPCGRSSSSAPPSTRSSPRSRPAPSFRPAPAPMRCSRASRATACCSATARTCCSPALARRRRLHAAEAEALLAALAAGGFTPPDLPALQGASGLPEREFSALCAALERSGRLVRFGGDLAYTSERFAEARERVVARCNEHESIALAELRDDLGASRRIAQGLLERLDADGVTRRVGDRRVLRRR